MSLKGCLSSVDRSLESMCRGHASRGAWKRTSEPSRHPVSLPAPFYLPLLAADWLMPSCITLNHSFSVSAASRTSWLDTQECDAPGFICIKGRVPRKGDETGIDLGGEPDGRDRRSRHRRRHAIQKSSQKRWCLMFPRHMATPGVNIFYKLKKKRNTYARIMSPWSSQVWWNLEAGYFNPVAPNCQISSCLYILFFHFHSSWMIKTIYIYEIWWIKCPYLELWKGSKAWL